MRARFHHLGGQAWAWPMLDLTRQEIPWLLHPRNHLSLLTSRRTAIIESRVQLWAGLFVLLSPMWVLLDSWALPWSVSRNLILARIATIVGLGVLVALRRRNASVNQTYRHLAMALAMPMAWCLFATVYLAGCPLEGSELTYASRYVYLPTIMLVGLAIIPLSVAEFLFFAVPISLIQIALAALSLRELSVATTAAALWQVVLVTTISVLVGTASVSQLGLMIATLRESIRDALTGCFSRRSGDELASGEFGLAARTNAPLSMAFLDLDHFKTINDTFGHDAGDHVLIAAAAAMKAGSRQTDWVIRWGGEEFLIIMPSTTRLQARQMLERLRRQGLGNRPDDTPVTASIGLAEKSEMCTKSWKDLVDLADRRMYAAKLGGRDRIVDSESEA